MVISCAGWTCTNSQISLSGMQAKRNTWPRSMTRSVSFWKKNTWSSLTIANYSVQIRFIENADDKNGRHRWQNRRIGKSMWKYGKKNVGRDELCFQCFQSQVLTHSGTRKYCPSNKGQCNVYIVFELLTFVLFHFRPDFDKWYSLRLLIFWRLIEIEINWFLK